MNKMLSSKLLNGNHIDNIRFQYIKSIVRFSYFFKRKKNESSFCLYWIENQMNSIFGFSSSVIYALKLIDTSMNIIMRLANHDVISRSDILFFLTIFISHCFIKWEEEKQDRQIIWQQKKYHRQTRNKISFFHRLL